MCVLFGTGLSLSYTPAVTACHMQLKSMVCWLKDKAIANFFSYFNTIVLKNSGEINSLIILLNSPEKVLFEARCQFEIQRVS